VCQECRDEEDFYFDEKLNGPSLKTRTLAWLEEHWPEAVAVACAIAILIGMLTG